MSPPRGSRGGSREGPGKRGKPSRARKGAHAPGTRKSKPGPSRDAGGGASSAGTPRGKPPAPRLGRSSNARVVWPPQARTETAREAIEQMMREAGLARHFEGAVEREARHAGARAWSRAEVEIEQGQRRDLRDLPTFTCDPATARDFDDAISARSLAGGGVRVWVHIADVAAHVMPGSPIDLEARRRSTSVYVPGAVEPMLPHALSSDVCSLLPGAERLAVTVELALRGARVESASFYRSLIRSDMRLDYEQVDRVFAGSAPAPEPWGRPLAAARAAAAELQAAREATGALVVDSEEPEFSFDEHGNVKEIRPRSQTESHRLIEHLMIAANEAVARQLTHASVPCLYRIHERPDPERVRKLVAQLASLGVPTPPLPDPIFPAHAAELVGEISRRVDLHVRRTGVGRIALSSLVLRSLKQACYSPVNLGHAGLRSSCYCHFTSPIRRYPDLVCHRALLSCLGAGEDGKTGAEEGGKRGATRLAGGGERGAARVAGGGERGAARVAGGGERGAARVAGGAKLVELGEWASERERDAARIEHKGDDVAACFLLEQALLEGGYEQVFAGEVTGLIGAGAFIAFGGVSRARVCARAKNANERSNTTAQEVPRETHGVREDAPGVCGGAPGPGVRGETPGVHEEILGVHERGDREAPGKREDTRDAPVGRQAGSPAGESAERPIYEGMLHVRLLGAGEEREWWSLNEQSTIMRGERSGATLRLGDPIEVRVVRVDASAGRVDLAPAR